MGRLSHGLMRGVGIYNESRLSERNAVVKEYLGLVKRVALHLKHRLPSHVSTDDLIQAGMIGLIDAVQGYKNEHNASFETYAAIRIRGEMLDSLRLYDWTPRAVHQNSRAVRDVTQRLSNVLGREPTSAEIAEEMGITVEKLHQMRNETANAKVMCLNDLMVDENDHPVDLPKVDMMTGRVELNDSPFDSLAAVQFRKSLAESISKLPEREQLVLSMYYTRDLNLKEIGIALNISESRACQLISSAQEKLREFLVPIWSSNPDAGSIRKSERPAVKAAVYKKKEVYKSDLFDDLKEQQSVSAVSGSETEQDSDSTGQYTAVIRAERRDLQGFAYTVSEMYTDIPVQNVSIKFRNIDDVATDNSRRALIRGCGSEEFFSTLTAAFFDGSLHYEGPELINKDLFDFAGKLKLPYHVHSSRPNLSVADPAVLLKSLKA